MTTDPMSFFAENVDSWGPAEWFDRMCKAAHAQDEAVRSMYAATDEHEKASAEIRFETFKMIVSSSARRLVEYEDRIRSALASPTIPEGWKLVPVEPTDAMIDAGEDEARERRSVGMQVYASDIYHAMLSTAPKEASHE